MSRQKECEINKSEPLYHDIALAKRIFLKSLYNNVNINLAYYLNAIWILQLIFTHKTFKDLILGAKKKRQCDQSMCFLAFNKCLTVQANNIWKKVIKKKTQPVLLFACLHSFRDYSLFLTFLFFIVPISCSFLC